MNYEIGQEVDVLINGKQGTATIFGFEFAWWGKKADWVYHLVIAEYPFDITVSQSQLINGINIVTNGNTVKVVPNEKIKAK